MELACDSAPMFKDNREFHSFADAKGIVLLFSPPYTQKLNSVVERPIRTLCEMAVAMSRHANMPKKYMNFAMKMAARLLNRMFRRMPDGTSDVPLWRYKGSKVPLHLTCFHPFGCAVEAVLPQSQQTRFGPKTTSCVFMGYDDNALSYILAKVPGFGLMQTAHAVFSDEVFPCRKQTSDWNTEVAFDADVADPLSHWLGRGRLPEQFVYGKPGWSDNQGENRYAEVVEGFDPDPAIPMPQVSAPATSAPESGVAPSSSSIPGPVRRSARGWQPSAAALQEIANKSACVVDGIDALTALGWDQRGGDLSEHGVPDFALAVKDARVPTSFKQISNMPHLEKERWLAAWRAESASHLAIPSISGVLDPQQWTSAAPIRLSWVFTIKPSGEYKARIVMLGQHMQEGIHFNDTFAPVPAATVVRLLFAMAASQGLDFTQLDVKTAFLTAPMDIELDVILRRVSEKVMTYLCLTLRARGGDER